MEIEEWHVGKKLSREVAESMSKRFVRLMRDPDPNTREAVVTTMRATLDREQVEPEDVWFGWGSNPWADGLFLMENARKRENYVWDQLNYLKEHLSEKVIRAAKRHADKMARKREEEKVSERR